MKPREMERVVSMDPGKNDKWQYITKEKPSEALDERQVWVRKNESDR